MTPLAQRDGAVAPDASIASPVAPRPIAPLSTATVTSRRPLLRWELARGTDGARVELCRDRACSQSLATFDAAGTSGAAAMDLPPGVVFWRLHGRAGDVVSPGTSPTWQFYVGARSAPVNTSWGTTLDVNGDGFADVAVGAARAYGLAGRVYVYLGGATGLATTPAATLAGPEDAMGRFGNSVASAGDVDGDGFADLVVGQPGNYDAGAGQAYVYAGSAAGLVTVPAARLAGSQPGYGFGSSVASAGDTDGDGYGDLVVNGSVYRGSAAGIATAPVVTLDDGESLAIEDHVWSVPVGDLNGDGCADLALGRCQMPACHAVETLVFLGSRGGLRSTASVTLTGAEGGGDRGIGYTLAGVGDVDGDGCSDLAVGAPTAAGGAGRVYVYSGSAVELRTTPTATLGAAIDVTAFGQELARAGDVDGDGYADVVVGAVAGGSCTIYLSVVRGGAAGLRATDATALARPPSAGITFGGEMASAGDTNGDGFDDVLVGQPDVSAMTSGEEFAYLYMGSARDPGSTAPVRLASPAPAHAEFGASLASVSAPLRRSTTPRGSGRIPVS